MTIRTAAQRRADAAAEQRARFDSCPANRVMERISDKWVALVFRALADGPLRRGDLARALPGASPKVLTETLRRLERDGLLARAVEAGVPVRVAYGLTEVGLDLLPVLDTVARWAEANIAGIDAAQDAYDARTGHEG
ncbi:winged helix-turn-helix transcriptional regulator [Yinghuangia soli]|uniref:Helix-turn-helix transcriptional regulator n=1 Tax=Yinghuangia soli TaxID=2908204 RepID=A0AA41U770_9ACTN|nr:helix-turn-helix domain-containing protein [Yinghuangia soli]MCF2531674.1 helix-turn-helix transcriptional regulator [Yinghuangia soli]